MSFAHYIKEIGRGADGAGDMSEHDAHQLFGAILIALRVKSETLPELLGFSAALSERLFRLRAPGGKAKPVVLPTYNGARHQPNLLPLRHRLHQRHESGQGHRGRRNRQPRLGLKSGDCRRRAVKDTVNRRALYARLRCGTTQAQKPHAGSG